MASPYCSGMDKVNLHGIIARGDIPGTTSAADIVAQLADASGPVTLSINSEGGEVFEGVQIFEAVRSYASPVTVSVDGIAGSIASYIAMAGKKIRIADGGFFMTHAAWSIAMGDADELRQMADTLDAITTSLVDAYAKRTGMDPDAAMQRFASGENWFSADEAVAIGLADEKTGSHVQASVQDATIYSRLPAELMPGNPPKSIPAVVATLQGKRRALGKFVQAQLASRRRAHLRKGTING